MIHPNTELRRVDSAIGYGVAATVPIPRGTITWVRDPLDQKLDRAALGDLSSPLRAAILRYAYQDLDGSYVLCWDHARYNNHSCRPACRTVGDFDIAVRDIGSGEELTIEYATINVLDVFDCRCGADNCRGEIHASDAIRFGRDWDAEVLAAARRAAMVPQPLEPLFAHSPVLTAMFVALASGRPPSLPACAELVIQSPRDESHV